MAVAYPKNGPKKLKVKNWKEAAKARRTCGDLAEKVETHKGL
jgi:hypothetical protein